MNEMITPLIMKINMKFRYIRNYKLYMPY